MRKRPEHIIPHADFGYPECPGLLFPVRRGDVHDLTCNDCGAVVATVADADLARKLAEMELSNDVATAQCPHCGAIHIAPGISTLFAFICDSCGESVTIAQPEG